MLMFLSCVIGIIRLQEGVVALFLPGLIRHLFLLVYWREVGVNLGRNGSVPLGIAMLHERGHGLLLTGKVVLCLVKQPINLPEECWVEELAVLIVLQDCKFILELSWCALEVSFNPCDLLVLKDSVFSNRRLLAPVAQNYIVVVGEELQVLALKLHLELEGLKLSKLEPIKTRALLPPSSNTSSPDWLMTSQFNTAILLVIVLQNKSHSTRLVNRRKLKCSVGRGV